MDLQVSIYFAVALISLGLAMMYLSFVVKLAQRATIAWGYVANCFSYIGFSMVFFGQGINSALLIVMGLTLLLPAMIFNLANTIRLRKMKVRAVIELGDHEMEVAVQDKLGKYLARTGRRMEDEMKSLLHPSKNHNEKVLTPTE